MRILCIGDSNTWGYNPENRLRFNNRWTKILQQMMPVDEIIEEGLNGRTILSKDREKPERYGMGSLKMILMTHQPVDLVIIMLGTNDLKKVFNCSSSYVASGICEYIKIIKNPYQWEKYYVPKILVISPIMFRDEVLRETFPYGEFDENSLIQSKQLYCAISDVCNRYDVYCMNAAEYAEASQTDGVHMDEENHQKLAKAIFNTIVNIMK